MPGQNKNKDSKRGANNDGNAEPSKKGRGKGRGNRGWKSKKARGGNRQ